MELLIIGGTRFLGRAIVDAALAAGHTVTLFNRGQSNPDLYPDINHIISDRDGGLAALDDRNWNAVIDTCGYVPRLVEASARYLAPAVDHYTFISTISVYADPSEVGIDESSDLGTLTDPETEEVTGETYGPLKVLCEQAATDSMHGRTLNVRSGLIAGPHDPTDRFSYWPARLARGGNVLAPGKPDGLVQFIDVRDIAMWVVAATEQRLTGPYNVTGPDQPLSFGELLEACRNVAGTEANLTWADEPFLLAHEVVPFVEMPLWLPADSAGIVAVNISKAQAAGLRSRPLSDTITATLEWLQTRPADHVWRAGISVEREAALLAEWADQS